jgi:hypothetical protein
MGIKELAQRGGTFRENAAAMPRFRASTARNRREGQIEALAENVNLAIDSTTEL